MGKKRNKKKQAPKPARAPVSHGQRRYQVQSNYRWLATDHGSPDATVNPAARYLRARSRHLAENNDLYAGVLSELVSKVVGTGLPLEPMGVSTRGRRLKRFNDDALRVWEDWCEHPETTGQLSWYELQRRAAYMSYQDGEVFAHHVNSGYPFMPGQLRYVVQLLEADYCPVDFTPAQGEVTDTWVHGIEHDLWGRPRIYYMHRDHPGNTIRPYTSLYQLDPHPAESITHYKLVKRWPQTRGLPIATPALSRMQDIMDYELDEMLTAKNNARNALVITKDPELATTTGSGLQSIGTGDVDHHDTPQEDEAQPVRETPPINMYELLPGENAIGFTPNRPNPEVTNFRAVMLRGVCSAVGAMYSNVARQYDSSYSAARQELVEGLRLYDILRTHFCEHWLKPIYRRVIQQAILERRLELPATTTLERATRFKVTPPGTPWIDPLKEAQADSMLIDKRLASRDDILRKRGVDPRQLDMQLDLEAAEQPDATPEQPKSPPQLEVVEDQEDEQEDAA